MFVLSSKDEMEKEHGQGCRQDGSPRKPSDEGLLVSGVV